MKTPTDSADFPLEPALRFLQRLWRLNHALERLSLAMDRRLGVTAQQRFVIRCVGKFPGLTAGHLAQILHLDPGTISTALRRLEDKGIIERRRDPSDSRRMALGLTAAGRALAAPRLGTVEDAAEGLLSHLPGADAATTMAALDTFTALLEARTATRGREERPSSVQRGRRPRAR